MADVVTKAGKAQAAGYLSNTVAQVATYYGNVGTGAGTASVDDTTLFTEVGSARVAITPTRVTTTNTSDTARYQFTYTAAGSVNVTNAAYFTASSNGVMMQKSDHAAVPLLATDSIAYTFDDRQA